MGALGLRPVPVPAQVKCLLGCLHKTLQRPGCNSFLPVANAPAAGAGSSPHDWPGLPTCEAVGQDGDRTLKSLGQDAATGEESQRLPWAPGASSVEGEGQWRALARPTISPSSGPGLLPSPGTWQLQVARGGFGIPTGNAGK